LKATLLATTALVALAIAPAAQATDGVEHIGNDPYRPQSPDFGISGDGRFVFSNSNDGVSLSQGWTYSNGAYTWVPLMVPAKSTVIFGMSYDGSVWVGGGVDVFNNVHMVRYADGILTDLHNDPAFAPGGQLDGYLNSMATAVSDDGRVVVGYAMGPTQAVMWTEATGVVGLGFLSGDITSSATDVSADGRTIVGYSSNNYTDLQAMYWKQTTGMVGLGFLPGGSSSNANAVNADGSVIVGWSMVSASTQHAFRWTQAAGMQDLGILPGHQRSYALAVSSDGSVVVGSSSGSTEVAFRWTQATGMQSLADMLTSRGIDLGGWELKTATGISADGMIIVGSALDQNGVERGYIARCQSAICLGLTTPEQLAASYAGQSAVGHTANAAIGGTLGTMQEYATQARASQGSRSTPYSVFAYGAYDTDPVTSGTLGITVDVTRDIVVGLSASAARVETDMIYNGEADMRGGGLSAFVARVPDRGLQWLAGLNSLFLDGDIERGYMNGAGSGFSKGASSSDGFGAIARVGWTEQFGALQLTPFASYTYSETTLDAYTEQDGVFAASFEKMTSTAETARFGADARYTFKPDTWAWGTLAWGHRLDGGKGADVTATLGNWFPMTVPGVAATEEWLEVGGGLRLPAWDKGAVTASLTASIPENEGDTTYLARAGLSQDF
jgi:probable HAF family extracellular repeat protein